MKESKKKVTVNSLSSNRLLSTHQPPGKDKALSNALLRLSDRVGIQERNKADKVVYCGRTEPIYGWTNTIPNPRYSDGNRPKPTCRKKKISKKAKLSIGNNDGIDLTELPENIDNHYHSYLSLCDMYQTYKKGMNLRNDAKKKEIVDPVTFKYIPYEERVIDDGYSSDDEQIKLPTLKMSHANNSNKLMEVLEKYMNRVGEVTDQASVDSFSTFRSDVMSYYDRYRWNFKKEMNSENTPKISLGLENKRTKFRHIKLPALTSEDNIEPSLKGKLARYVNGAMKTKQNFNNVDRKAFYLKLHQNNDEMNDLVKLERRRKHGDNEQDDHWVARVIVKKKGETGTAEEDSTTSSVVIIPDTRWKQRQGVADGERKRMKNQMERQQLKQIQDEVTGRLNKHRKKMKQEEKKSYRFRQHSSSIPAGFTSMDTAKVSMKYDVETSVRKGVVRGSNETIQPSILDRHDPILPAINRNLTIGADHVTVILPPRQSNANDQISKDKESNKNHHKQSLLNRKSKSNAKSRLDRISAKQGSPGKSEEAQKVVDEMNEIPEKLSDPKREEIEQRLPVVLGSGVGTNNEREKLRVQTPSSSTFNSDKMLQQVIDTAKFLKKSTKESDFIRYKVLKRTRGESEKLDPVNKKASHPPKNKNRGREKIQDLVGQEREFVKQAINEMNSTWTFQQRTLIQDGLAHSDAFKAALSTAMANAGGKFSSQVPKRLVDANNGKSIMKRRVVPPIHSGKQKPENEKKKATQLPRVTVKDNKQSLVKNEMVKKTRPRAMAAKLKQTLGMQQPDANVEQFVCSGDVIVKKRPTPKLLENNFAASISSVKPTRRILNLV